MAIELNQETRKHALASLKRFCHDEADLEVSDLQTIALLAFILKEIAPSVYNLGIADAQTFVRDRLGDLEATCAEPEFAYWPKGASVRRKL